MTSVTPRPSSQDPAINNPASPANCHCNPSTSNPHRVIISIIRSKNQNRKHPFLGLPVLPCTPYLTETLKSPLSPIDVLCGQGTLGTVNMSTLRMRLQDMNGTSLGPPRYEDRLEARRTLLGWTIPMHLSSRLASLNNTKPASKQRDHSELTSCQHWQLGLLLSASL